MSSVAVRLLGHKAIIEHTPPANSLCLARPRRNLEPKMVGGPVAAGLGGRVKTTPFCAKTQLPVLQDLELRRMQFHGLRRKMLSGI